MFGMVTPTPFFCDVLLSRQTPLFFCFPSHPFALLSVRLVQAMDSAALAAASRLAAAYLPSPLSELCLDSVSARLAGFTRLPRLLAAFPATVKAALRVVGPVSDFLALVALRTRVLDETILGFLQAGGAQVVLLGAGFDSRGASSAATQTSKAGDALTQTLFRV